MATKSELTERLARRFKGVPNFDMTDAQELVDESLRYHGIDPSADVPADKESVVLLYAQIQGAWQIAFAVAHYFKFTDGEESVDKSMVADNYRRLARDLQEEYEREADKVFGNNFRIMPRLDRPNTTPPTGESGKRLWRRF
mgnify:CR=1 FL=1